MPNEGPLKHSWLFNALTALFVLLLANVTSAQSVLDPAALPPCAEECTILQQAQSGCVPPAAPATDQQTYESCFCQSVFLQPLFTSPNGVCDQFCTERSDLVQIQGWFTGLCQAQAGVQPSSDDGEEDDGSQRGDVLTLEEDPAAEPADDDDDDANGTDAATEDGSVSDNGNWVDNHWEWIVFLVMLILGIIFFSVLGVWLKRRYRRKRDLAGVNLAAPEAVAPEIRQNRTSQTPVAAPMLIGGAAASAGPSTTNSIMPDVASQTHLPVPAPSKTAWSISSRPDSRPPSRVWTPDSGAVLGRAGSSSMALDRASSRDGPGTGNTGGWAAGSSIGGRRSSTPTAMAALDSIATAPPSPGPSESGSGNGKAKERVDSAGMRHGGSKLKE